MTTNRPGVLVSNYTTGEVRGVETTYHPWKKGDRIYRTYWCISAE
ncbi:hypothetical protein [Nostoc sp. 'Peltigera malacea cyanobiont' DB3992]|nr:hypothetical protein [Nostoc sp. 'Peltigera malacea cyanobiont' DB3992]